MWPQGPDDAWRADHTTAGPRRTSSACSGAPASARRRKEARYWAARSRGETIDWLLRGGSGPPRPRFPKPQLDGKPLDPINEYGQDVLWWLDKMVRTPRPLVEKTTLFWHDHFATLDQDRPLQIAQNKMLRRDGLGSFRRLLTDVTKDPAMLLFLSLADSRKEEPNENYARELMELFTLGKGYTEKDIREAARALTGFRSKRRGDGSVAVLYDAKAHDATSQADLRQARQLRLPRRARPLHRPSSSTRRFSSPSCGSTSSARRSSRRRASAWPASTATAAIASRRSCARSSSTPRCTARSTRPTWSSRPSSTSSARCAPRARGSRARTGSTCSTAWASSRSARRRWPAGSGGPRGCRRTRCTCASTAPTSCCRAAAGSPTARRR